jgi:hypothetical protein
VSFVAIFATPGCPWIPSAGTTWSSATMTLLRCWPRSWTGARRESCASASCRAGPIRTPSSGPGAYRPPYNGNQGGEAAPTSCGDARRGRQAGTPRGRHGDAQQTDG